jgi:hypothetical protein
VFEAALAANAYSVRKTCVVLSEIWWLHSGRSLHSVPKFQNHYKFFSLDALAAPLTIVRGRKASSHTHTPIILYSYEYLKLA